MTSIEINDAPIQLPLLIDVVLKGEEIIFTNNNKPIAKLIKMQSQKPERKPGSAAGKNWMAPDFNELFNEYSDSIP